jgi:hypothetical protein
MLDNQPPLYFYSQLALKATFGLSFFACLLSLKFKVKKPLDILLLCHQAFFFIVSTLGFIGISSDKNLCLYQGIILLNAWLGAILIILFLAVDIIYLCIKVNDQITTISNKSVYLQVSATFIFILISTISTILQPTISPTNVFCFTTSNSNLDILFTTTMYTTFGACLLAIIMVETIPYWEIVKISPHHIDYELVDAYSYHLVLFVFVWAVEGLSSPSAEKGTLFWLYAIRVRLILIVDGDYGSDGIWSLYAARVYEKGK